MSLKDQANQSLICKCAKQITDSSLRLRAISYGYPAKTSLTFGGAKDYLAILLKIITSLGRENFFARAECVLERKFLFFALKKSIKRSVTIPNIMLNAKGP